MRVLISGAGIGGLALAGFLKDSDIECTIIDKAPSFASDGFSIGLWANGRRMLEKLGVGDEVDRIGIPFKRMVIQNGAGKILKTYELSQFDERFGMSIVHVPRHLLHQWTLKGAGNPIVRMNTHLTALEEKKDFVSATFSDGSQENFDLVVGADGVHSSVRELILGAKEKFADWRAWWFWTDASFAESHTIIEYLGSKKFVVLCNEGDRTLAVLMAYADHTKWDEEAGRIERIEKLFADMPIVQKLLAGKEAKDVMPSDLMEVKTPHWHTNRAVLLGDAAHAMLPFVALGASMALEDAYILAGELLQLKNQNAVPVALAAYEKKRAPRIRHAERLTDHMRLLCAANSRTIAGAMRRLLPFVPAPLAMREYLSFMQQEV